MQPESLAELRTSSFECVVRVGWRSAAWYRGKCSTPQVKVAMVGIRILGGGGVQPESLAERFLARVASASAPGESARCRKKEGTLHTTLAPSVHVHDLCRPWSESTHEELTLFSLSPLWGKYDIRSRLESCPTKHVTLLVIQCRLRTAVLQVQGSLTYKKTRPPRTLP